MDKYLLITAQDVVSPTGEVLFPAGSQTGVVLWDGVSEWTPSDFLLTDELGQPIDLVLPVPQIAILEQGAD